jgi:hypothetical protein
VGRRQTVAPAPPGVESTESVLVLVGAAEALAHADLVALMTLFA